MRVSLRSVVRDTVALGVLLPVLALLVLRDAGPVLELEGVEPGPTQIALMVVLLLATMLANLVAVPVRRGEQVEELTLLEAALIADVLLLPARHALWLPVAAVVLSFVVTRRHPLKSAFNAGNLAASSALLVLVVQLVAGPDAGLSGRTVLGLLAGLAVFTVTNLANLARVLTAVQESQARTVLTDGARLAVLTLPGHVSIAGSAVLAASTAPALLPFAFVPAAALIIAYRARAQQVEERARSAKLLELSHALAVRRDAADLLPTFLQLCRRAFDADVVLAVLPADPSEGADGPRVLSDERGTGFASRPAQADERALLGPTAPEGGRLEGAQRGRGHGLLAPLEAEGQRLGVVVLRSRGRRRVLTERDLLLLTPLASLLAAALRAAQHVRGVTEATSKLQAVVDQSSDGILVLDGIGSVQLWSPALTTLTGVDEAAAIGRPFGTLLRVLAADGTPCDAFVAGRGLLTPASPEATVELTLLRADGEQRVIRCAHAGAFVEDMLLRDVVLVHDITRERQVERLKADFIATVSHELRTPVTPIKGYADLLLRRGHVMTDERRNECLAVISERSEHLARLVEDLLLASRISASEGTATRQVDLTYGDLVPVVRRAAADFGVDGGRLRLTLPDLPILTSFDPTRTVQVLTNLIGNALKYSPPGTPVDVRMSTTAGTLASAGDVVVEVSDVGRGIPADQLEQVFEKFHRVEDPMRMTTSGTGLGLYIARQLATAMGGDLRCTSTLGAGSTFRFSLPADPPPDIAGAVEVPLQLARR